MNVRSRAGRRRRVMTICSHWRKAGPAHSVGALCRHVAQFKPVQRGVIVRSVQNLAMAVRGAPSVRLCDFEAFANQAVSQVFESKSISPQSRHFLHKSYDNPASARGHPDTARAYTPESQSGVARISIARTSCGAMPYARRNARVKSGPLLKPSP